MPAGPIVFYFDFSSPYSYIASEWIAALAARHGRRVSWKAVLLGATFQAAELKSPVSYPIKREYSLHDFERSARFAGVPLSIPGKFPIPTQNAARLFWWLHDQDEARAVDAAVTTLAAAIDGPDREAIQAATEALAQVTDEFAARRMDAGIRRALAGKSVESLDA